MPNASVQNSGEKSTGSSNRNRSRAHRAQAMQAHHRHAAPELWSENMQRQKEMLAASQGHGHRSWEAAGCGTNVRFAEASGEKFRLAGDDVDK